MGAVVVFFVLIVALALFVTEALPPDMTAIGVLVALAVLEPWTSVQPTTALQGFASPAVVTIIAMYILSAGVQETGVVEWLGAHLARIARGSEGRFLSATLGSTGIAAGLVNNTPVVAVFIPMVSDLADDLHVSPSKYLMPLSFAAMLGGTLTLVGTSMNLLASDLAVALLDRPPIGMFEFTPLGILVFLAGLAYLMTIGQRLTPARIAPDSAIAADYDLERQLAQVKVRNGSPLIGRTATDIYFEHDGLLDIDVLQVERERTVVADRDDRTPQKPLERTVHETFMASADRPLEAGDLLTVRANLQVLNRFAETYDLRQLPREEVSAAALATSDHPGMLVEVLIPPGSSLIDKSPRQARFSRRYDTTVLGVRRGDDIEREGLRDRPIRVGDTLLLQTTETALADFYEAGDMVVTDEPTPPIELPTFEPTIPSLDPRAYLSVGVLLAAVFLAATTRLTIPVTALAGVVTLVATGCLSGSAAYDAVSWDVIFLLAGIIPLGVALQATGGATYIGDVLGGAVAGFPLPGVIFVLYLLAAAFAAVVTPVATIVFMIPVAVELATAFGGDGFPFLLATLFGASAAYITPIGYQTNLMVYGPGGYRFTDFARVGLPLQLFLAVVTTAGILIFFPP